MVNTIIRWHIIEIKWINPFQASNVVAVLLRVGSALMMRVYATVRAKVMLRGPCIKLIKL
jgi:hypothetical protein